MEKTGEKPIRTHKSCRCKKIVGGALTNGELLRRDNAPRNKIIAKLLMSIFSVLHLGTVFMGENELLLVAKAFYMTDLVFPLNLHPVNVACVPQLKKPSFHADRMHQNGNYSESDMHDDASGRSSEPSDVDSTVMSDDVFYSCNSQDATGTPDHRQHGPAHSQNSHANAYRSAEDAGQDLDSGPQQSIWRRSYNGAKSVLNTVSSSVRHFMGFGGAAGRTDNGLNGNDGASNSRPAAQDHLEDPSAVHSDGSAIGNMEADPATNNGSSGWWEYAKQKAASGYNGIKNAASNLKNRIAGEQGSSLGEDAEPEVGSSGNSGGWLGYVRDGYAHVKGKVADGCSYAWDKLASGCNYSKKQMVRVRNATTGMASSAKNKITGWWNSGAGTDAPRPGIFKRLWNWAKQKIKNLFTGSASPKQNGSGGPPVDPGPPPENAQGPDNKETNSSGAGEDDTSDADDVSEKCLESGNMHLIHKWNEKTVRVPYSIKDDCAVACDGGDGDGPPPNSTTVVSSDGVDDTDADDEHLKKYFSIITVSIVILVLALLIYLYFKQNVGHMFVKR
ncbi:hypothetical protein VCUG_01236 [Vavraia culicis subsp. floridensis]|uniref:Uncharacterized protein n=1 Tax=Vavraia culicis (isolate floridensis) TaxID=948595 RepID=L2GVV2_VAVCU|nr:uncharacterized protein VCUG_01236 [Vavraia culicis subsp. floridensis]ELA47240.1 hypothetical protein VCUG_01236 [Vavraia culicis subsp. floridensis]